LPATSGIPPPVNGVRSAFAALITHASRRREAPSASGRAGPSGAHVEGVPGASLAHPAGCSPRGVSQDDENSLKQQRLLSLTEHPDYTGAVLDRQARIAPHGRTKHRTPSVARIPPAAHGSQSTCEATRPSLLFFGGRTLLTSSTGMHCRHALPREARRCVHWLFASRWRAQDLHARAVHGTCKRALAGDRGRRCYLSLWRCQQDRA
jgi:hypothetical protein